MVDSSCLKLAEACSQLARALAGPADLPRTEVSLRSCLPQTGFGPLRLTQASRRLAWVAKGQALAFPKLAGSTTQTCGANVRTNAQMNTQIKSQSSPWSCCPKASCMRLCAFQVNESSLTTWKIVKCHQRRTSVILPVGLVKFGGTLVPFTNVPDKPPH